jgi:hypothetical protein
MKYAEVEKVCTRCHSTVRQRVAFDDKKGRLSILFWSIGCPSCHSFLKKPLLTELKVSRSLGIK